MHDILAYGTIASCATKGYQGCPCSVPGTISRTLVACHKIIYCSQHRRWFPNDHVYTIETLGLLEVLKRGHHLLK